MSTKPYHSANAGTHYPFIYMILLVEIRDAQTGQLIHAYETDLADSTKRRVFAEQMSEAYAAGQMNIAKPLRVQRRLPEPTP